jgi:hypothetical protein
MSYVFTPCCLGDANRLYIYCQVIRVITQPVDLGFFFTMAQQPPVGKGHLIIEDSRPHNDALQSVGLLWTSDQPVAETST